MLGGEFSFLNRSARIGWPPDWNPRDLPALWRYNLHYHDFLWSLPFDHALAVTRDWIRKQDAAGRGGGWDAYPVSLRIQNWCTFFFGEHLDATRATAGAEEELWTSLELQTRHLEKRVEWHLLGNHIVENAAAFVFAGSTFGSSLGDAWMRRGIDLLATQLPEIVLPDGGHAERSPMYQARLCLLMENLSRLEDETVLHLVAEPLRRTRHALSRLTHPDGGIALLNDSAHGIYPNVEPEGIGSFALPDSGYYGARTESGHYVVCDAGPIGPDYQPGHAHGDTLSFELSLGGKRFVVDTGVYGYEEDEWRALARSTRAHNTVEINRLDQSDFWGAFRVGRRARPRNIRHDQDRSGFCLEAEHDGYEHLAGSPIHRRRFRWHRDGVLLIRDRVLSGRDVLVRSRFHLHPDVSVIPQADGSLHLTSGEQNCMVRFAGPGGMRVEASWYFPEFGQRVSSRVIVVEHRASEMTAGVVFASTGDPVQFDLEKGARFGGTEYAW